MNARELALDIFLEAEKTGSYVNTLIRDTLDKYDYEDPKEKAFLKCLSEGTMERRITLDWALNCYSKTPTEKMKPLIRNLLRLSAYQILYMETVPDSAACNEAVKLAKKRGFSSLSGFVNGVLRSLARNKHDLPMPDAQVDPIRSMSVRFSLPEWMIRLWTQQYGSRRAAALAEGSGKRRPVIIRFHSALSAEQKEAVLEGMRQNGVSARKHPLHPGAYVLEGCEGVANLPGFAEGMLYAQDVSSMLAVEAAGIHGGMKVLDLCSAPGGKAVFACEKLGESGVLRAGDLSEAKAAKLRENAARMGCDRMEISVRDATCHSEGLEGWADVVLADVPCSGLGVLARKKDIRYRVCPEDLKALTELQRKILTASWQYVKPGGVLLYSTCTVNRMENEEMVDFITKNFPFETESLDDFLPPRLRNEQTAGGLLQLYPGEYDTDGFFIARLRRKSIGSRSDA